VKEFYVTQALTIRRLDKLTFLPHDVVLRLRARVCVRHKPVLYQYSETQDHANSPETVIFRQQNYSGNFDTVTPNGAVNYAHGRLSSV